MNITKGNNLSLSKAAPGLDAIMAAAGWEKRQQQGYGVHTDFDLDLMGIPLDPYGNRMPDNTVVFFNNKMAFPMANGRFALMASVDDRDGSGKPGDDDEAIGAQLNELLRQGVTQVVFSVSIYDAHNRQQNFGMIKDAFVRLVDMRSPNSPAEITKFDLDAFAANSTIVTFGVLRWTGTEWKFFAVGEGYNVDLGTYLGAAGEPFRFLGM